MSVYRVLKGCPGTVPGPVWGLSFGGSGRNPWMLRKSTDVLGVDIVVLLHVLQLVYQDRFVHAYSSDDSIVL